MLSSSDRLTMPSWLKGRPFGDRPDPMHRSFSPADHCREVLFLKRQAQNAILAAEGRPFGDRPDPTHRSFSPANLRCKRVPSIA